MLKHIVVLGFLLVTQVQALEILPAPGPHTYGPNCWNGAMVATDVLNVHRFIHPDEFRYLLSKNCEQVSEPSYGSLGRLRTGGIDTHAFVWLNSTQIFAKHSQNSLEPYKVMDFSEMWKDYYTTRDCKTLKDAETRKDCKSELTYYRCQKPTGDLQAQIEILDPASMLIHELVFSKSTKYQIGSNCLSEPYLSISSLLENLEEQILRITDQTNPDPTYLKLWVASASYQLYETEVRVGHIRCKDRTTDEKNLPFKKMRKALADLLKKYP